MRILTVSRRSTLHAVFVLTQPPLISALRLATRTLELTSNDPFFADENVFGSATAAVGAIASHAPATAVEKTS